MSMTRRKKNSVLRNARLRLGLTQADVSRMSGVTVRTIQRAEAGHEVRHRSASKLARVLGTDVFTMFPDGKAARARDALEKIGVSVFTSEHARENSMTYDEWEKLQAFTWEKGNE